MEEPLADLPKGEVTVTQFKPGWWIVQIGRARYTKRFNLSTAEAMAMAEQFTTAIGELPGVTVAGRETGPTPEG